MAMSTVCFTLVTLWVVTAGDVGTARVDTAVVCPIEFRAALGPWVMHRGSQGHGCVLLDNDPSCETIRKSIRSAAQENPLKFILLVGDADPAAATDEHLQRRSTPTFLARAKVNVRWGSEPELATDNWFADLDDDQLPDLAIGRLPADSPRELERLVSRIIAYETSSPQGTWRQRINFVAGVGGFGALTDSVLESTTRKFLTDGIPSSYFTSMTYGSWRSPFCPDPSQFHDATLQRFNEGCLFWVYIGHGQRRELDRIRTPSGSYHIFDTRDTSKLRSENGCPIALFLACYVGAFDHPRDCLAEEMLRAEGGPIAILCGSRVTMPYAMAVLGDRLMHEYFDGRRATLGEVFLNAKRSLAKSAIATENQSNDRNRQLLDALAKAISPDPELLEAERIEHVQLFNLLGDPLLRLPRPQEIALQTSATARAGQRITLSGKSPINGSCIIELVCRRDTYKTTLVSRPEFHAQRGMPAEFAETYLCANDRSWASHECPCADGTFQTELEIPRNAKGHCHLRVVVANEQSFALGAVNVFVHKALESEAP